MITSGTQRISKNIIYNGISFSVTFVVNFALLPFIIANVGKEIYGIYALILVITGYLTLFDFGTTGAIIKHVAEFYGGGDHDKVNEVISASLSVLMVIGVISAVILLIIGVYFDSIFKVDPANRHILKELFVVAAFGALFIWPGKAFEAALFGVQAYGWLAINNIGSTILTGIAAYIILSSGYSIVVYLAAYYIISMLRYISSYIILYHRYIDRVVKLFYYPKQLLKQLYGYGSFLFLGSIMNIVILQLDNILIGAYLSVSAVTLYAVVYNLQNLFRAANSLIGSPLFPYYAEMEGQGKYDQQRSLMLRATRFLSLAFVSMVVITIIYAGPIIRCWMGDGFVESILPAQILLCFWIFNGTLEVGGGMISAKGYVKGPFMINFINAICNLTLSLILIRYLGIVGVVLGTTIPMILVSFPMLLYQILKVMKITLKEFLAKAINNNIIIYIIGGITAVLVQVNFYPKKLIMVILEIGIVYLITLLTGYRWFLGPDEKEDIRRIVRYYLGKA